MFQKINLINALSLMSAAVWMYKSSVNPSVIHLMPFVGGIILLALNNGIREGSSEQIKVAFYFSIMYVIILMLLLFLENVLMEEGYFLYIISLLILSFLSVVTYIIEKMK